jgi:hypothetical protein
VEAIKDHDNAVPTDDQYDVLTPRPKTVGTRLAGRIDPRVSTVRKQKEAFHVPLSAIALPPLETSSSWNHLSDHGSIDILHSEREDEDDWLKDEEAPSMTLRDILLRAGDTKLDLLSEFCGPS